MTELDASNVAERAGVELAYVTHLLDLGLVDVGPDGSLPEGQVRRVQMLQVVDRGGVSLDALATVVRGGGMSLEFIDAATYDAFSPLSNESFSELSDRSAIPLDLLLAIRDAVGGAAASPHDRVREDELEVLPLVQFQLAQGFRPIAIERGLRVYGTMDAINLHAAARAN